MTLDLDALEQFAAQEKVTITTSVTTPLLSESIVPLVKIARAAVAWRASNNRITDFDGHNKLLDALRESGL